MIISAALNRRGDAHEVLDVAEREHRIALSDAVLGEVLAVLSRPKIMRLTTDVRRRRVVEQLTSSASFFAPALRVTACRDPKDDKYLELALAARADVIVTGDTDLLALHPFRGIPVLTPAAFVDAFGT